MIRRSSVEAAKIVYILLLEADYDNVMINSAHLRRASVRVDTTVLSIVRVSSEYCTVSCVPSKGKDTGGN